MLFCASWSPAADAPASASKKQPDNKAVLNVTSLDAKPVVRTRSAPQYPFELRRQNISGEAVVEFVVNAKGDVENARVVKATHPEFGEAAVAAVSRWKFSPGKKDGQPVATRLTTPITFSVESR